MRETPLWSLEVHNKVLPAARLSGSLKLSTNMTSKPCGAGLSIETLTSPVYAKDTPVKDEIVSKFFRIKASAKLGVSSLFRYHLNGELTEEHHVPVDSPEELFKSS